jgi:D-methionine transport system ATP-binding protein
MIQLKSLTKTFPHPDGKITAVDQVALTINTGEIFGIIGLSGAGKSTLVRLINRLEEAESGEIWIDDTELRQLSINQLNLERKEIGMIFQHFNLLQSRTVEENVAFPLELAGMKKNQITARVQETLDLVGLADKAKVHPAQLSGGQKQRVAIARAIANRPKILLCDEATSALDPQTTKSILTLIKELKNTLNLTVILITHEMEVIREICERVAVMENGAVIECDAVETVFSHPKTKLTRSFVTSLRPDRKSVAAKDSTSYRLKLTFLGDSIREPLLSRTIRKHNVEINILAAEINQLATVPVGNLLIEVSGSKKEIESCVHKFQQQEIQVEVVSA